MNPIKKVLAPIDLSGDSLETVRFAADLARRYEASLTILHVYQTALHRLPEGQVFTAPAQPAVVGAAVERLAAAKTEALAAGAQVVETLLLPGGVSEAIVHVAAEQGYDLIVMGRHERRGCDRMLFGSLTESVSRTAPCPLVSMRLTGNQTGVPRAAPVAHDTGA